MRKRLVVLVILALLGASCASSDSPDDAAGTTVPAPTSTDQPPNRTPSVGDLLADPTARKATVAGAVIWTGAGARLCDVLMESFPPQCGEPSIPITNPSALELEFLNSSGVWWNEAWSEIDGYFDGESFTVDTDVDSADITSTESKQVMALVAFARAADGATIDDIGFAEEVMLGVGDRATRPVQSSDLTTPSEWVLDVDDYDGYAGPFSALDIVRAPLESTVGPHSRCVADATPPPAGMESFRQISIQPTDATSCLEWWAVDLYLNPNGEIAALVLDLYGP